MKLFRHFQVCLIIQLSRLCWTYTFVEVRRRRRDLNPRAAINDLLPFQGSPFSHLGTSPKLKHIHDIIGLTTKRRRWDSNPRPLSESPVFKTGSLNHSDTSPRLLEQYIILHRPCQGFFSRKLKAMHSLPSIYLSRACSRKGKWMAGSIRRLP